MNTSHNNSRDAAKSSLTQPFKHNHTNQENREIRMLHISRINRYAIVIHSMLHTLVSFCFLYPWSGLVIMYCGNAKLTHTKTRRRDAALDRKGTGVSLRPSARVKRHAAALRLSMLHACTVITGKSPRRARIRDLSTYADTRAAIHLIHATESFTYTCLNNKCVNNNLE